MIPTYDWAQTPQAREPFTVMRTQENYIPTFTGKQFWPLAPIVTDICIEDIAHALANENRFTGHTRRPYSVADHSIRVSAEVERQAMLEHRSHESLIQVIELSLWGLLHDAPEAYLKDLPHPIKHAPGIGILYKQYEGNLMDAISLRFDLMPIEPAIVKDVDNVLLATEQRDLINISDECRKHGRWSVAAPLTETIIPRTWHEAEREFLWRYSYLIAKREMYKAVHR